MPKRHPIHQAPSRMMRAALLFWGRGSWRGPLYENDDKLCRDYVGLSIEVNLGNNATRFRLECDIFGTGNAENQAASPFLHNLSSILYTGSREGVSAGVLSSCRAVSCIGRRRSSRIVLCASGVSHQASRIVRRAVCGFCKLAENFFKKVLDRNRRSVNIVDAPFTGN